MNTVPKQSHLKLDQLDEILEEYSKVVENIDDDPIYLEYEAKILDERKDDESMDYEEFKKKYNLK
jgi:hypothetical protein